MESLGAWTISLGPPRRGGPDSIRSAVQSALSPGSPTVVSQQVSDHELVTHLARLRLRPGVGPVRVMLERDYLFESRSVEVAEIWGPAGRNEANREALLALLRAAVDVRFDHVRGELLHVNLVVSGRGDGQKVCLTSANLSTSSLDRHLNWAVTIEDPKIAARCREAVASAWDGDFRDAALDVTDATKTGRLVIGADGQASECLSEFLAEARSTIHVAFFNAVEGSLGVRDLIAALDRGVRVSGVVDADQGNQAWDGVPSLLEAGADIRYYPGARTGAVGRMHHKMAVTDRTATYFSTANLSRSAMSSLESAVLLKDDGRVADMVIREVDRLGAGASRRPLTELVI